MSLDAGKLRHRIALESQIQTQDPVTGDITTTWASVAEVWASIEPLSAREFIAAQAVQSQVNTRITIRWRAGVTTAMRARRISDGTLYDINGVLPDNVSGREWITLVCATGVTDGR